MKVLLLISYNCISLVALVPTVKSAPNEDLVAKLPGSDFHPNFQQYSGYLRSSNTHFLHYWFVLSQNVPATDPVILWLSGGPGCSSVSGSLQELGPFRISNYGKSASENVYAWNKVANVIFLESPAGVGYSYSFDGNTATNDDNTTLENYNVLIEFFTKKFPEYKTNDFYITGESYAGVYLPLLGRLLIKDSGRFPTFKGLAVGNPLLNYKYNMNYMLPFLYNHGIIGVQTWQWFGTNCCSGDPNRCNYFGILEGPHDTQCFKKIQEILTKMRSFQHMNPYNLYFACYLPTNGSLAVQQTRAVAPEDVYFRTILEHFGIVPKEEPSVPNRDSPVEAAGSNTNLPLCAQYTNPTVYMNRADVRETFHIPRKLGNWSTCNLHLRYHRQYTDMTPFIKEIIEAGKKVLVYNGDVDSICNAIANQVFVDKLNQTLLKDKTVWTYAKNIPDAAGFVTRYQGIDFATVRGAGHFVPFSKPREALQMLYNFIQNKSYSTPTNINVKPQPFIGGFCNQSVLSPTYFNGPVPAWQLCGHGSCVSSSNGAQCSCFPGYTEKFCNKYVPKTTSVQVQLCAAYPTAQTKGIIHKLRDTSSQVSGHVRAASNLTCRLKLFMSGPVD